MTAGRPGTLVEQHAHVLFDIHDDGRLVRVDEPDPTTPSPHVFVTRGHVETRAWFGVGVPAATVGAARHAFSGLPPWDGTQPDAALLEGVRRAIATDRPIAAEVHGPAMRLPTVPGAGAASTLIGAATAVIAAEGVVIVDEGTEALLDRHFPYTRSALDSRAPVAVAVRAGVAVAACNSARRRPWACEAGVHTMDGHERQGLATAVVAAWRDAVVAAGMTPLYSTTWDDLASRRVAEKLGAIPYADTAALW
jgi:hypothetical protein